jgi:peptide/nickel transport system permease protein
MTTSAATAQDLPWHELRPRRSIGSSLWRIARQKPVGAIAAVVCLLLILVAIFAPLLAPHPPDQVAFPRLQSPSLSHPFGTDNLFRDVFSRTIVSSRVSLGVGFTAVFLATAVGALLGILSGYLGGWVDLLVSRLLDVVIGMPPLIFAIFMLTVFERNFTNVSMTIAIIYMPTTARIVRSSVLSVRNLQYIEAAQAVGNTPPAIMWRHVLPNVFAPIIVVASIQIGNAILTEAALSFLGLGIATDAQPSWGKMLQDSRPVWQAAWWMSIIPGGAISIAVLAFNLFGDALRDVLDPRLRGAA